MENESTFVAPEGVYSVTEEHKPLIIPTHTISTTPASFPTRISSIVIRFSGTKQGGGAPGFAQLLGGNKDSKKVARDRDDGVSLSSSDTMDEGDTGAATTQENAASSPSSTAHEPHTLFSHPPAAGKKKPISRPKHNIRTTSSTFITRIQNAEGVNKALQTRQGDATFLFYNSQKAFVWIEPGAKIKVCAIVRSHIQYSQLRRLQEPLARVTFSAYPTCHDVNTMTASPERMDIIIGFNTGDLVWLGAYRSPAGSAQPLIFSKDPITSRYGRLNKQVHVFVISPE